MIENIRDEFKNMLDDNTWMDEESKKLAKEKVINYARELTSDILFFYPSNTDRCHGPQNRLPRLF
jgi:hypothetical protein